MTAERAEPRPCEVCKRPIIGGQLYVIDGPCHVACRPPARLDVAKVTRTVRGSLPGPWKRAGANPLESAEASHVQ